ncbi:MULTISPECIES: PTS sugar transporter subunit IIA [Alicyclobacillus]|uniref:Mannitol-specific phosphotransferase enzyme IIA component n=1 Tax=Alicyclobacillus acidoterrestris (strain ATCC 49025 / DSM 3922 / CIP 106132 / NCIMB 13137 / GD3B) TaxID=1356854 RepID=T0BV78_ALIAG|nr:MULTISPECIES: PTS sugar transporter subunit IIA [Alicyclobacillus]EPZ44754.1 PTS mannitol transporter subunit IIA [Alicyclobacillus acidoterrestris ATCC 49025]UNO48939.1 PTS sugar transporter subunit IIA [Alicyclobacillus acidoterrestris]GEO27787.1 PTS mannitol transporter subunit IIA [Alicyclobacillus acidoterrestris]
MNILQPSNVLLQVKTENKTDAIRRVGQALVDNGYVEAPYIEGMLKREESMTTYIGNQVAIPHSMPEYVQHILHSGIVVAQYPDGVDFGNGNIAKLVIGIAGRGEEHMEVLSQIATVCMEEENVEKLVKAQSAQEVIDVIGETL